MLIFEVAVLIVLGVINTAASAAMKMQVNARIPEDERLSWWSRDFSEVGRRYREIFPRSPLPNIARYSGWICLVLVAAIVFGSLWRE